MPNGFIVEFAGICCHYDPIKDGVSSPPYLMRSIILRTPADSHLPHLEVQVGGVKENNWGLAVSQPYPRDGVAYQYIVLNKVRLTIEATEPPFEKKTSFKTEVPRLPLICDGFGNIKTTHYLDNDPNAAGPDIVAAHFDMTYGELFVGARTTGKTTFNPPFKWPEPNGSLAVPFPRSIHLKVNTAGDTIITARAFSGGSPKTLVLHDWVPKVRIGNLTENGRLGLKDNDEQQHFHHYYAMAGGGHCDPEPIPKDDIQEDRGLGGGCSNTNYP